MALIYMFLNMSIWVCGGCFSENELHISSFRDSLTQDFRDPWAAGRYTKQCNAARLAF